ncbi:MAG TPA: SMP-30/gluconolactonase/LRE family protein [Ktedonobacteraceae bacterium]|nr:SMP-30/gluconolactonase/LRE family protein [Ktedonobacteraceae bacterium]
MIGTHRSVRAFFAVCAFLPLLLVLVPAPVFAASGGARPLRLFSSHAAYALQVVHTSPDAHRIIQYNIPSPGSDPHDITTGPDGNLWFVDDGAGVVGNIGKITPQGQFTQYPVPDPYGGPWSITSGPGGDLWFTLIYDSQIASINPHTGKITLFNLPPQSYPDDITAAPDGNLWFTQDGKINSVGKMTPDGKVTEYPLNSGTNCECGITVGPDGNLWIAEDWSNHIAKVDIHTGHLTLYNIPGPGYPPNITTGPDGNLWFTNGSSGQIGKFDPTTDQFTEYNLPNAGSLPDDIVSDGSQGLWFTEYEGFNVGHITLNGKIKEFPAPYPGGITRGPGSDFWFVEQQTDAIAKITSR